MAITDDILGIAVVGLAAGVALKITDEVFSKHKHKKKGIISKKTYIPGISMVK